MIVTTASIGVIILPDRREVVRSAEKYETQSAPRAERRVMAQGSSLRMSPPRVRRMDSASKIIAALARESRESTAARGSADGRSSTPESPKPGANSVRDINFGAFK